MSGLPNPFADEDKEPQGPSFSFYSDPLASYQPGGNRGARGGGRGPAHAGRRGPQQAAAAVAGPRPPSHPPPPGQPMVASLQHPSMHGNIPANWCGTVAPQQPAGHYAPQQGYNGGGPGWQGGPPQPGYPPYQQQYPGGPGQGRGWDRGQGRGGGQGRGRGRGGRGGPYHQPYQGPPQHAGDALGPPSVQGGWQTDSGPAGPQSKLQRTGPDTRFNQGQAQGFSTPGGGRGGGRQQQRDDMSRFYKPSFSQDPWAGLMQRLASVAPASGATAQSMAPAQQAPAPAAAAAVAQDGATAPVVQRRRNLADVMDETMNEFAGVT